MIRIQDFHGWDLSVLVTQIYFIRVVPGIDHSGIDARIVLEQNKFSKKVTSNRDWTLNPGTVVLVSCVYSIVPSQLSYHGNC